VACTANALRGEAESCLAGGMDDYLAKPIDLKNLAEKLDVWLPVAAPVAPVDRAVLAELTGNDPKVELEILSDFRRVNDDDAAMLEAAVGRCDTPVVMRASHRMKGASLMVGARSLAAACERLERAGRASDWTEIGANMAAFHHELERFNSYCDAAR